MGTGGSRWRAGRPGWRRKCEHLLGLDVRRLAREGRLCPGSTFGRHWSRGGEPSGNITVTVGDGYVRLCYRLTPYGQEPLEFDYQVGLARTPCHYGGSRPWFVCPRCHSRRAVLYGIASDGRFGCRKCMRLAYASETESVVYRITRKSHKLEAMLGEDCEKRSG